MSDTIFPAPGHSWAAHFGDLAFRLDFDSDGRKLAFAAIGTEQAAEGNQTVEYTAVPLREGLFLVYWQEAGGTTVSHVEDFAEGRVHTNITSPDGTFFNASGSWEQLA